MDETELYFFDNDQPTYGALFAGIGGFCAGFNKSGYKGLWATDICRDSAETYSLNYPQSRFIHADIRELTAGSLEPVTVLHGGFPCQSFSQAGNRLGFEDDRGRLFFEIIRLIKEWGELRPPVVLLENSPFILLGDNGNWFEKIKGEFQKLGYWFNDENCVELSTNIHGGSPQRRKRAFMCALDSNHFDYNPFNQYLFSPRPTKKLSEVLDIESDIGEQYFLDTENKYSEMITSHLTDDPYRIYQLRKHIVRVQRENECPTLTANMGGGGHNVPFIHHAGRIRKLTERECLELQGFEKNFCFPDGLALGSRYRLIGNSVSPEISKQLANGIKKIILEA